MKLVLAVVDGCRPAALDAALATGEAPAIAAIVERGSLVRDSCAAFPSVTPVCATTLATGVLQDRHHIPSMNWFHRAEGRYVEYGSSMRAARRLGIGRQLQDLVFRMNGEHLSKDVETVFESLDDAGARTAGTTFLIYRGRYRHAPSRETPASRFAGLALGSKSVMGPRELFYADVFASRETGCFSQLGRPGARDQHAGCVAAWLAARDLFDFLLLSLPDNDTHSHEHGPDAQIASIALADAQILRVAEACGGLERFLETHAVIVAADHSHTPVGHLIDLPGAFAEMEVAPPRGRNDDAEVALCPAQRSAMVYGLVPEGRPTLLPRIIGRAREIPGVDVVCWRDGVRAAVASPGGELRFWPGTQVRDLRGNGWDVAGDLSSLGLEISEGLVASARYPDALRRIWAALACPTSGDVLLSAALGWEFPDWGGGHHVGAGSHGSLHAEDSLGVLAFCGLQAPAGHPGAWSITDVAAMVREHFGLPFER